MTLETIASISQLVATATIVGGIVVVLWRKLAPWAIQIRNEQSQPSWAEWFEWLAHQCERHKSTEEPAYIQHSNWVP